MIPATSGCCDFRAAGGEPLGGCFASRSGLLPAPLRRHAAYGGPDLWGAGGFAWSAARWAAASLAMQAQAQHQSRAGC